MEGKVLDDLEENRVEVQKLLLVDDTPTNLDLLIDILQDEYEIRVAINGLDALKQVKIDSPDLILLGCIASRH